MQLNSVGNSFGQQKLQFVTTLECEWSTLKFKENNAPPDIFYL